MQVTITIPTLGTLLGRWRALALFTAALAFALFAARDSAQSAGTNSITTPDGDVVGGGTSLALDAVGNPVVSYFDAGNATLSIMHCNDANCAGGDESITSPSPAVLIVGNTSLALDAAGRPVVSYHDFANGLWILHCNDVNCAGGGESLTSPDTAPFNGATSSLALDAAGNPVVSYENSPFGDLMVMHCNDANCAGGGESITSPDTGGANNVGGQTSLALDAVGRPVVSYYDSTNGALKIMHCNDVNCAGGGESITTPDTGGSNDVGVYTSLVLDASGRPVVSHYDITDGDLRVMHCNDVNCAGGNESITSPDTAGDVGAYSSLALDVSGRPVVSYQDVSNGDLKVMHCNDANCTGGGEIITSPDMAGDVGESTSLALDAAGRPVVSYLDTTNEEDFDLKVLHCGTPLCTNGPATQDVHIASLTSGWPAGPMGGACYEFNDTVNVDTFLVCDNETGAGVDTALACGKGGDALQLCTDDDPTVGSIRVALLAGQYLVTTDSAPGHNVDPDVFACNPAAGVDAKCSFTHTPLTRPWFPWDVNGDGAVAGTDFFGVLGHFGQVK